VLAPVGAAFAHGHVHALSSILKSGRAILTGTR
jgi:hypothetical protein